MGRRVSRFTGLAASSLGAIAAAVIAGAPSSASGAEASVSLSLSATVGNTCRLVSNVTGIAFDSLSANTAAASSAATLTASCDIDGTQVTVEVDNGLNSGLGGANGRKLKSTTADVYIPYSVCSGTPNVGDCAVVATETLPTTSAGVSKTIYAQIAAQAFTRDGAYADTLGVKITF